MKSKQRFTRCALTAAVSAVLSAAVLLPTATMAQEQEQESSKQTTSINIQSQPIGDALSELAQQLGLQITLYSSVVSGINSKHLVGNFSSNDEALDQMLAGTGLVYRYLDDQTVMVSRKEEEKATEVEQESIEEVEEVVVTGSRVARNPAELAGQLLVFGDEQIKASGATTLERFLRRLPQNVNGDSEFAASSLNGAFNMSGASTANLRGLGSQATLILVDGHRMGHDGFLGGVTDISSIPLSRVERIEVLLDGASAVYGADAVGGVINVITKKDYQGVIASMEYEEPHEGGFHEWRFDLDGGISWDSGSFQASFSHSEHSGLALTDREHLSLSDPNGLKDINASVAPAPGPQGAAVGENGRFGTEFQGRQQPLFYTNAGDNITLAEYAALDPADQAMYSAVGEVNFPEGFTSGSDLNELGVITFDEDGRAQLIDYSASGNGLADAGRLALPIRESNIIGLSLTQDLSEDTTLRASVSYENRDVQSGGSALSLSDAEVHAGNPYNPFGTKFNYTKQIQGLEPGFREGDVDRLHFNFNLDGKLGSSWDWKVSGSHSNSSTDAEIPTKLDTESIQDGLNSDGGASFVWVWSAAAPAPDGCTLLRDFGWARRFECPAVTPIDPFADFSAEQYLLPSEVATSENKNTTISGMVDGTLFSLPAGDARFSFGVEWHRLELSSASAFNIAPADLQTDSVVQTEDYEADISRDQQAFFVEGLVPLVGEDMGLPAVQSLNLSLSGRYDSYGNVNVNRNLTISGEDESLLSEMENQVRDPGADSTWGLGLIWTLNDQARIKLNKQTAFVAPQLNQLINVTNPFLPGFLGLDDPARPWLFVTATNVQKTGGGNSELKPETSRSLSAGLELTPDFLPGLTANITWHETQYNDKISRFNVLSLDPFGYVPSNITILDMPEDTTNIFDVRSAATFLIDDRWTNLSAQEHQGIDYRVRYEWSGDYGDFFVDANVAHTRKNWVQKTATDAGIDNVGVSTRAEQGVMPEYAGNLQFSWSYRGLTSSLDVNYTSDIEYQVWSGDALNKRTVLEYPTTANLTLSYDVEGGDLFKAPEWMSGSVLTLGVQNLTDDFSASTQTQYLVGTDEVLYQSSGTGSAQTSLGRGRVFRLNIRKEF